MGLTKMMPSQDCLTRIPSSQFDGTIIFCFSSEGQTYTYISPRDFYFLETEIVADESGVEKMVCSWCVFSRNGVIIAIRLGIRQNGRCAMNMAVGSLVYWSL